MHANVGYHSSYHHLYAKNIKQYLKEDQKFIVAGATHDNGQEAVSVTLTAPSP